MLVREISHRKSFYTVPDGLKFDKSIQTPLVSAGEKQILSLESPTKTLFMNAAQGVRITSIANDIKMNSLYDFNLVSQKGKVGDFCHFCCSKSGARCPNRRRLRG